MGRPSPFHITTNRTTPRNSVTIRRGNNSPFHNSRKRGRWRVAATKYSVKLPTDQNRKATILTSTTHGNAEGAPGSVPRAWVLPLTVLSEQISTAHSNCLINYLVDFSNIPYYHGVCSPRTSPVHSQPTLAIPFVLTTIPFAFPLTPFF